LPIEGVDHFIVAFDEMIYMYDDITYKEKYRLDLDLPESDTDDPIMIISLNVSTDGNHVAVATGKTLVTGIEIIMEIIILKRNHKNKFQEKKRINMASNSLSNICKKIYFDQRDKRCLIFVTNEEIITYNFELDKKFSMFDFKNLAEQPEYFIFDEE